MICHTYRYRGHHVGDVDRSYYRPKQEEEQWKTERDPLRLLARWLMDQGIADEGTLDQIHANVKAEIKAGVQFALDAPYPDPGEVDQHVYA